MSILYYHIVCIAFISLQLSKSDILWHYSVANTDPIPTEWAFTGSGTVTPVSDNSNCPQTTTCWQGYSSNKFDDWELTRTVQTTINYENILFSYQLSTYIDKAGMFCNIEYTTDNETNWYPITNIEGPTPQDPNAYFSSNFSNWNPSPSDNPDGIKIRVTSTDTGIQGFRYCWVNELKLTADSLTPTTATPTTATPTTFTPTTTIPTTTAPTTATPTSNPTTSQPTTPTTNPTTSHPTSPTTPTMPPTTPKETSRTQEEGESNSGSTSGNTGEILVYVAIVFGVLLLIVCVGCIVYKNKSKKHQESNATVENEIAAQYMDAYASGGKVSTPVPPPNTGNINANNDGNTEYDNRNQYGGNINANDGNRNQYGGYDGQYEGYNQNQNENENQMKTEQQVVTNDANSGPAPPVELTQIFGPTQNERVSANRKDSDEDSIMKKQSYFNEHESND